MCKFAINSVQAAAATDTMARGRAGCGTLAGDGMERAVAAEHAVEHQDADVEGQQVL